MAMHPDVEKASRVFVRQVKDAFGIELVSVILYGSAAAGDFHPARSDVNFLVVLTPPGIASLKKVQRFVAGWTRKRILFPLFMTRDAIESSLDSYPVEFFNMKQAYVVLEGTDVLAGLSVSRKDLRLQCERELKGKLLHLRQEYVLTRGKTRAIRNLIAHSIVTFSSLFRALLFLKGRPAPANRELVLTDTCGEFHLELALFQNLLAIREKGITYTKFELDHFMERYIAEIERLCGSVDQLAVN